jgi:putative nucleotidyltransferase with HDIG domain
VSQVESLPSSPRAYGRLSAAIDAPNASLASVTAAIEKDMAMSAKLLQLANSAFVGARHEITRVSDAVRTVGLDAIRHYILSPFLNVFAMFEHEGSQDGERFSHLGEHALLTAHLAATLARSEALRPKAFTAGLLHDIGSLVLLTRVPDVARALAAEAKAKDCAIEDLEQRRLGVTHAEVGAYLLGLWGLPSEICNAVSRHHERGLVPRDELTLTLQVANWLAREHEHRTTLRIVDPGVLALDRDEALLEAFGVGGDIPRLLAVARDCDARLRQTSIVPPPRGALR